MDFPLPAPGTAAAAVEMQHTTTQRTRTRKSMVLIDFLTPTKAAARHRPATYITATYMRCIICSLCGRTYAVVAINKHSSYQ
jgi:hypothetical protein